jgi:hypothetical protein
MTELDPATGLPVIPGHLITDELPDWRWEVIESLEFLSDKHTGYQVRLTYRWQYSDRATVTEPSWWRRLFGVKLETTVTEGEVAWVVYGVEPISIEDLSKETILRAAEEIISRVMIKHERSKLLGAYPPNRLDTGTETE